MKFSLFGYKSLIGRSRRDAQAKALNNPYDYDATREATRQWWQNNRVNDVFDAAWAFGEQVINHYAVEEIWADLHIGLVITIINPEYDTLRVQEWITTVAARVMRQYPKTFVSFTTYAVIPENIYNLTLLMKRLDK